MTSAPACIMTGLMFMCGAAARGQAIISSDLKWADANIYQLDQNDNHVGNPQFTHAEDSSGLDFSASVSTSYNDMGFVGTASCNWNHVYSPGNAGSGNAFSAAYISGSAAADSTSDGQWVDLDDTFGSSVVFFSVASDTAWTLTADILGMTSGAGQAFYGYSIFDDLGNSYAFGHITATDGQSIDDSLNIGGVISAGNYFFQLYIGAGTPHVLQQGSGTASIELTSGVFTVPAPGASVLLGVGGLGVLRRRR